MIRISTIFIAIFTTFTLSAQKLDHDYVGKWFAGVNVGAAWNTTDVKNKTNLGWGFIIGRSFNYKIGQPISFDVRLRYLNAKYYGQDTDTTNLASLGNDYTGPLSQYKKDYGHTIHNFENKVNHLGLELSIHFNNFVDRTGWDPYIFGGVNLSWNKARGNLINSNSPDTLSLYDYSSGNWNQTDLEGLLDKSYETSLEGANKNNIDFVPSVGFGIGYHLTPQVSIGLEHKTSFTLKDRFDGIKSGKNDLYHYTGAYLKFRFKGRRHREIEDPIVDNPSDPDPITPPVDPTPTPCDKPRVKVMMPTYTGMTVTQSLHNFKAKIKFVNNKNELTLLVNGMNTNFNFIGNYIEAQLPLKAGKNDIELRANTSCGQDAQIVTINYKDCFDPVINLTSISGNHTVTDRNTYQIIGNIANATNVEMTVNGTMSNGFIFNPTTGVFQSNVNLMKGVNTIRIVAKSTCGTVTRNLSVEYQQCAPPVVSFQRGNSAMISIPSNASSNFMVEAFAYNIKNKNQIQVQMNGIAIPFNFNPSTGKVIASVALRNNNNNVRIVASNTCGRNEQFINVNKIICNSPKINLVTPSNTMTQTIKTSTEVRVGLQEITSRNQIRVLVNGLVFNGGTFDQYRKEFSANLNLRKGSNSIQIIATNNCGTDTRNITVVSNPCSKIDLQFSEPRNGFVSKQKSIWVRAYAHNANSINELSLSLNGINQGLGSFNASSKLYQKQINLRQGINTINLSARNACGNVNKTITITYTPCVDPVLSQVSPTRTPFKTKAASFKTSAKIENIVGINNIQMTVNGVLNNRYHTYTPSTKIYFSSTDLKIGQNIIRITATNNCSSKTLEFIIIREKQIIEDKYINICYNNKPTRIKESEWPKYAQLGAVKGNCPEKKVIVCFRNNTMEIPASQLDHYLRLGARKGNCPEKRVIVCFKNETMEIPSSQLNHYLRLGAKKGECQSFLEKKLNICYQGNSKIINESEWPKYSKLGATKGGCPQSKMTICFKNNNMIIPASEWSNYQKKGAIRGKCPELRKKQ